MPGKVVLELEGPNSGASSEPRHAELTRGPGGVSQKLKA
jgi:hypothetical protein